MRKHGGIHTWKCVKKCIGIIDNTGTFIILFWNVVQFGRIRDLGSRGRTFKSCHSNYLSPIKEKYITKGCNYHSINY